MLNKRSFRQNVTAIMIYIAIYYIFLNAVPSLRPYNYIVWPMIAVGAFLINIDKILDAVNRTGIGIATLEYGLFLIISFVSTMGLDSYDGIIHVRNIFVGTVFAIAVAADEEYHVSVVNAVSILSILMLSVSFMQLIAPDLYASRILPRLTLSEEVGFQGALKSDMIIGLTNGTSQNGIFMSIGFIVYLAKYATTKAGFRKIFYGILALVFFGMIFATGKRSYSLIAVLIVIVLTNMMSSNKMSLQRIVTVLGVLSLLAVVFSFASTKIPVLNNVFNRTAEFINNEDISNGRTALYKRAIEAFEQKPFFGIGVSMSQYVIGGDVHNEYIQFLLEYGAVFVLVPLITIFHPFIKCARYIRKHSVNYKNKDGEQFLIAFLFMIMILAAAMFALPFQMEKIFTLFIIFQMICLKKISRGMA